MSTHKIKLLILALLVASHSGYVNAEPPTPSAPVASDPATPDATTANPPPAAAPTRPAPVPPTPKSTAKDIKKDTSTAEQDNYVKKTIVSSCEIKPVMADEDYYKCKITPPSYLNHFR